MFNISCHRGGTTDYQGDLFEADGTTQVVLASTDHVRVKIGGDDQGTPTLDLDSVGATANGSVVTIDDRGVAGSDPATYTLRLAQGDTALLTTGAHLGVVGVVDDSETAPANAFKPVEEFVLYVKTMQGGDVGLT